MPLRGIRGAVQVRANTRESISRATQDLIGALVRTNRLNRKDIAAVFFTMTPDLRADFPARAARACGWTDIPMLCSTEIGVPGAMGRVIRVLVLVNGDGKIHHQYLGETAWLRPDLTQGSKRRSRS